MLNEKERALLLKIKELKQLFSAMSPRARAQANGTLEKLADLVKVNAFDRIEKASITEAITAIIKSEVPTAQNVVFKVEFDDVKETSEKKTFSSSPDSIFGKQLSDDDSDEDGY